MAIHWGKDSLFNKWYWNNGASTCKKLNPDIDLTPFIKINSKWFIILNIKHKTIKFLENSIAET